MQLKGTSATGTSRKVIEWTLADKIAIYKAVKIDKVGAKQAFENLAAERGFTLPASYLDYPHSHVWRFQKEFKTAIAKGRTTVVAALTEAGLTDE